MQLRAGLLPAFFVACCFLCVGAIAQAPANAQTPEQWLMQMSDNTSRLSYSGSLVYTEGGRMETMKIYHALNDGVRRERLVYLTGEPREFIRRGDSVECIDPVNGLVKLDNRDSDFSGSSSYAKRFAALREPYSVSFAGKGRVAGRDVSLIALRPKDNYRHGFNLALDSATKLLLRSQMVDAQGVVLERFEYTQIEIGGVIADADLEPQLKFEQALKTPESVIEKTAHRRADQSSWRVGWVPPAYTMSGNRIANNEGSSGESRLMYSDGLSAFSVFVEENADFGHTTRRRGATMAHTVVAKDAEGLFSVTVVGEIPLLAAEKIAASVVRRSAR